MKEKVDITMDINKSELLKMLSAYYTEKLNKEANIKLNISKELRGYGYSEYNEVILEFYFVNEHNLGPAKVKITNTLTKEDVNEALSEIIEKLGYSVDAVNYKTGTRSTGYYDDYEEPYFEGVTLNLKQKGMKRVLE
ncbi:MAG: hypothetical protein IKR57_06310 [Bacilli bacterium]|nr:hypothetical protein [Bacilli bacterium]